MGLAGRGLVGNGGARNGRWLWPATIATALAASSCGDAPSGAAAKAGDASAPSSPRAPTEPAVWGDLLDEAAERGLDYVNHSGEPAKATILESNGAGVA